MSWFSEGPGFMVSPTAVEKRGSQYGLNPVGARIWNLMQEPRKVAEIQNEITNEYEVEPKRCARDLVVLLEKLLAEGLIEVKT
jgi:hypothetical protein